MFCQQKILLTKKQTIAFDFIRLSDLNSNPNNLTEILFLKVFLVDCLLIALKILKYFLSGLILIKPNILFYCFLSFRSQYFCRCVHFHQFLLRV